MRVVIQKENNLKNIQFSTLSCYFLKQIDISLLSAFLARCEENQSSQSLVSSKCLILLMDEENESVLYI